MERFGQIARAIFHDAPKFKNGLKVAAFRLTYFITLTYLIIVAPTLLEAANTELPVEALKSFVESPPIIEEVDFKITHPPTWPLPPIQIFTARWQPSALFLEQWQTDKLQEITNIPPYIRATGHYENYYWDFIGKNKTLTEWEDKSDSPKDSHNGSYSASLSAIDDVSRVLNIGIPNLGIGTIKWQGDTFEAASDLTGARKHGTLIRSATGYAEKLTLKEELHGKASEIEIVYSYPTNLELPFFPSKLSASLIEGDKKVLLEEIFVSSLKISKLPLEAKLFGPDSSMSKYVSWRYKQISNSLYLDTPNGLAEEEVLPPEHTKPSSAPFVFVGVLMVTTLLPAAAYLFRRQQIKK